LPSLGAWSIPDADAQTAKAPVASAAKPAALTASASDPQRGEYLARAGDWVACHTTRGGQPFAGGLEMATPFGKLYTPNITPDRDTGIGKWTAEDFWRALHFGRMPNGSPYYPAFPYNQRALLNGWRTLYFEPGEYEYAAVRVQSGIAVRISCRVWATATRAIRGATSSARRGRAPHSPVA
jgi:hypothetical protein